MNRRVVEIVGRLRYWGIIKSRENQRSLNAPGYTSVLWHAFSHPQARLAKLNEDWSELVRRSSEKSKSLQEARRQAEFNAGLKDVEFWLGEVEQLLENDDLGKDLMSVRNLVRWGMISSCLRAKILFCEFKMNLAAPRLPKMLWPSKADQKWWHADSYRRCGAESLSLPISNSVVVTSKCFLCFLSFLPEVVYQTTL